jgi:hypothetical protein
MGTHGGHAIGLHVAKLLLEIVIEGLPELVLVTEAEDVAEQVME